LLASQSVDLITRFVPGWYVDFGSISVYFSAQKALPAKTRVLVYFLLELFQDPLSEHFYGV
jgi:hypothetical protein